MKKISSKKETPKKIQSSWVKTIQKVFRYLILWTLLNSSGGVFSQNENFIQENNKKNEIEIWFNKTGSLLKEHEENLRIRADTLGIEKTRETVLIEINREREKEWLSPLKMNPLLTKVAQNYAEYMNKNNWYSHRDKTWKTWKTRVHEVKYDKLFRWENIHNGPLNVFYVMRDWMSSALHANNILWVHTEEVGIGYCNGYRVLVFGWRLPWDKK